MAVFLDNLSVHKTKDVQKKLKEHSIPCLFNVPYQPDFNPCESCLSKVKNYYKREKLKCLVRNESVNYEELIKQAIK